MSPERPMSKDERVSGIVGRQITDYASRFEQTSPGFGRTLAIERLSSDLAFMLAIYEGRTDMREFFTRMSDDPNFNDFVEMFLADVGSAVEVPFPSVDVEDRIAVATAASNGLSALIAREGPVTQ